MKKIDEIISKLTWAVNLYSQAGDESNNHLQYRKLHDEARAIIMNEVIPNLTDIKYNPEAFAKAMGKKLVDDVGVHDVEEYYKDE